MEGTKAKNKINSSSINQINSENQLKNKIKDFINKRDSEWYIIGNNLKEGPYNDFCLYSKIYQIYYESFKKKKSVPNYILNNKKTSEFMTLDDCFKKLDKKFGVDLKNFLKSPIIPISYQLEMVNLDQSYTNQMLMFPFQANFINNNNNYMLNQAFINNYSMYNNIMNSQDMMNNKIMNMNIQAMNNGQILNYNQINYKINENKNFNNKNQNNCVNSQNNNDKED